MYPHHSNGQVHTKVLNRVVFSVWLVATLFLSVAPSLAGSWDDTKAPMPTVRHAGASVVYGDLIFTINGHEGDPGSGRIVQAYDTATDTWSDKATYPRGEGRYLQGAATHGGDIYVFGGTNIWGNYSTNTVDRYNIASDSWTTSVATYPLTAGQMQCATVDNYIYCFGGAGYAGSPLYDKSYRFDPATGLFAEMAPMPTPRAFAKTAVLGRDIYTIGGWDTTGIRDVVEIYHVDSDSWSPGASLPIPLDQSVVGVTDGKIYVASGYISFAPLTTTNRAFVYESGSWNEIDSMGHARGDPFGGATNGKFYVMGGYDNGWINYTEEYTPSSICHDLDGDGFGLPGNAVCSGGSEEDCNDSNPAVYPGADELCDGLDNDCDGVVPASEADADDDGFRVCENDCDDVDDTINPDAIEIPGDRFDDNCDGSLGACDPSAGWRNHGQFVRCVAHEVNTLIEAGLITEEEGDALVRNAAHSDIGK